MAARKRTAAAASAARTAGSDRKVTAWRTISPRMEGAGGAAGGGEGAGEGRGRGGAGGVRVSPLCLAVVGHLRMGGGPRVPDVPAAARVQTDGLGSDGQGSSCRCGHFGRGATNVHLYMLIHSTKFR